MNPLLRSALAIAALGVAACSDGARNPLAPTTPDAHVTRSTTARVTNAHDAGPGSFRAAVERANDGGVSEIEFSRRLRPIRLTQPVVYTGAQALTIEGNGATLDGSELDPAAPAAFLANGGSDLTLAGLTVQNATQQGIAVEVPATASGIRKITLRGVAAIGNRGHGVLINDQVDPEDTGNAAGSNASLQVEVFGCRFVANGFGALDRDGLRINEGGDGDLVARLTLTRAEGNGADGVEFDERGAGDVRFFNDNLEEGFDFNENHEGDMRVEMTLVDASRNLEEGIDLEEDDDFQGGGDLIAILAGVRADGNGPGGDAGVKIRERGDGSVDASLKGVIANDNRIGGISVREDALGSLVALIDHANAQRNAGHGIDFDENNGGDLAAAVRNSTSSANGGAGVRADQQLPGVGTLRLEAVTLGGNAGGPVAGTGVTVTQTP